MNKSIVFQTQISLTNSERTRESEEIIYYITYILRTKKKKLQNENILHKK